MTTTQTSIRSKNKNPRNKKRKGKEKGAKFERVVRKLGGGFQFCEDDSGFEEEDSECSREIWAF